MFVAAWVKGDYQTVEGLVEYRFQLWAACKARDFANWCELKDWLERQPFDAGMRFRATKVVSTLTYIRALGIKVDHCTQNALEQLAHNRVVFLSRVDKPGCGPVVLVHPEVGKKRICGISALGSP
jgi:hypothetical protein